MQSPSFRSTLYRYWFFGWLFRDVTRGSLIERAAAWRHNRANACWLPVYLRRWTLLGGLCFLAGLGLETLAPPLVQAVFYLPSAISVSINAVTLAAWMGLKLISAPS